MSVEVKEPAFLQLIAVLLRMESDKAKCRRLLILITNLSIP
jgi:hypothetical protein